MSLPPPSGADDEDDSVSLGFEVDATPETFDTDAFTVSLADELGVDAATLSTEVVDNGPGNGIRVVVSGAPAAATDALAAQSGTELSASLGVPVSDCLLYTSPSPRDRQKSRMPSSA